jgi:hypothetical protein
LIAEATANGIKKIAEAIQGKGGNEAIRMRIVEQYIDELGKILNDADITVVPEGLAKIKGFFEGVGRVSDGMSGAYSENIEE